MLIIVLPPQAQEGAEGTTHGCCITMGGGIHTVGAFSVIPGMGMGVGGGGYKLQ